MRITDELGFRRAMAHPCSCGSDRCPGWKILLWTTWSHWGSSPDEQLVYDPLGRPWTQTFFNPEIYPALRVFP